MRYAWSLHRESRHLVTLRSWYQMATAERTIHDDDRRGSPSVEEAADQVAVEVLELDASEEDQHAVHDSRPRR